ncbi:MAG TPA: LacI family DNA-binding transcriptional regulator [Bryobacteraceae bacterium]|nr:LacI family DNA-binding transcriptional regulator [Bryobacteraceae bacterium]
MKDIAEDLGVSLMTVSKALRKHSDISEKTRNRVLKRMRELNYQPDWIARSMVTGRTFVVGLVLPNLHSFFGHVAKSVARKLQPLGYQVVICDTEEDGEVERRHVDVLVNRRVDGLIIASAQRKGRLDLFRMLDRKKIRYVLIDRMLVGAGANYVGVKDDELGAMATEHLIAQGCRRVAHIRGPAVATGLGRLAGYRRALARHGLRLNPAYVSSGPYGDNTGYDSMRELLGLHPRPDGVFCYNDHTAAGAMKAILEAQLRVPDDVAVIGAGNVRYSDLLRVPLSTIDQSCSAIGETAADLLVNCMDSRKRSPVRQILIPPRLVVRASSRRKE